MRLKQQELMLAVNSERDVEDKGSSTTLAEYWKGTFSAHIAKYKRASTSLSYEDLWRRHIEPAALGQMQIGKIETHHVNILTGLTDSLGRNSLNHVRSTLSAVLTHALNGGIISRNPVSGCKVEGVRAPGRTEFYTEEEVHALRLQRLRPIPVTEIVPQQRSRPTSSARY